MIFISKSSKFRVFAVLMQISSTEQMDFYGSIFIHINAHRQTNAHMCNYLFERKRVDKEVYALLMMLTTSLDAGESRWPGEVMGQREEDEEIC